MVPLEGILMPAGRPTKYKIEYCQAIIDYFDIDPYIEAPIKVTMKNGSIIEKTELRANDMRFLSGFARKIGVDHSSLTEWANKYPEFSSALKKAKKLQENHLVTKRSIANVCFFVRL